MRTTSSCWARTLGSAGTWWCAGFRSKTAPASTAMSEWETLSSTAPAARNRTPAAAGNGSDGAQSSSVLGPRDRLVGQLYVEGDVRVAGTVEGGLEVTGSVENADGGRVTGPVNAHGRLVGGRSGSLVGDVRVARLVVQDGATFTGKVSMGKQLEAPPKPVEPPAPVPEQVKAEAPVKAEEAVKAEAPVTVAEPPKAPQHVQAPQPAKVAQPVKVAHPVKSAPPVKAAQPVQTPQPVKGQPAKPQQFQSPKAPDRKGKRR